MASVKLPSYVRAKRLKDKATAYYWELPSWAKPPTTRHGRTCPVESQALGTNLATAIEKANFLNGAFEDWRKGVYSRLAKGSVAWLFAWYREQERFTSNSARTRQDYVEQMEVLRDWPMKVGTFGERRAGAVDASTADTLYVKLKEKRGHRQGTYAMQVARLVWTWAVRHRAVTGVDFNPFSKMNLSLRVQKGNRATSREEYDLYRATAHKLGVPVMAAAAALSFELCQRVSDVFCYPDEDGDQGDGFRWEHYVEGESIGLIQSKGQRRTGGKMHVIPLSAIENRQIVALYPDLETELATLRGEEERAGHIILHPRTGRLFTERQAADEHRKICKAAGLPKEMTLTGFRHGGTTEVGDTGEADTRAITGHTQLQTTAIYNKASVEKARKIGLARRSHVEKKSESVGTVSE